MEYDKTSDTSNQEDIRELYNEINKIKNRFDEIEPVFKDKTKSKYKEEDPYILAGEVLIMIHQLSILSETAETKDLRFMCLDLYNRMVEFSEEYAIKSYNIKMSVLIDLRVLTDSKNSFSRPIIIETFFNIVRLLNFTKEELLSLTDQERSFLMSMKNYISLFPEKNDYSISEKDRYLKELVQGLFDFVLESYNRNIGPFTFYEKIMLLHVIRDADMYLR